MRKLALIACSVLALGACSEKDPILPGTRTEIFASPAPTILNTEIKNLPDAAFAAAAQDCPYTQDATNTIRDGDRKIFSGFPTSNSVKSVRQPVCNGKYVYAGLTTGELVKVNPKTRQIVWIADIYRASNITGGASVLDIVAPIVITEKSVYVGGLGDAFCKIDDAGGNKKWCLDIGTANPFIIAGHSAFVVATDGYLYAVRLRDGAIYWRTALEKQATPKYADGVVTVGRQKINAKNGQLIK